MLHVYERRAGEMEPVELLRRFEEKRTSRPVRADARRLHRVEGQLFASADKFEAVAPAPVLPLGATVDGGKLDWTARLLCDRAEWCFSSGVGVDRLVLEDLTPPEPGRGALEPPRKPRA